MMAALLGSILSGAIHDSTAAGQISGARMKEFETTAKKVEAHYQKGIKLLYNGDLSHPHLSVENAPAATAEFTAALKMQLAFKNNNPDLYANPVIDVTMMYGRANTYKYRAFSYSAQGKSDLSARDCEAALSTVKDLKPKLELITADKQLANYRKEFIRMRDMTRDTEYHANALLGTHYYTQDKAKARGYLKRAMDLLPQDDPRRAPLDKLLRQLDRPPTKRITLSAQTWSFLYKRVLSDLFDSLKQAIGNKSEAQFKSKWDAGGYRRNLVGGSGLSGKEVFEQATRKLWYLRPDMESLIQSTTERGKAFIVRADVCLFKEDKIFDKLWTVVVETRKGKCVMLGAGKKIEAVKALVDHLDRPFDDMPFDIDVLIKSLPPRGSAEGH